jgi:hypothetical protein
MIDLWVTIVAYLAVFVVEDDSLITLLDIVLTATTRTSLHKWELITAVVISRIVFRSGKCVAPGVIVGERVWVGFS